MKLGEGGYKIPEEKSKHENKEITDESKMMHMQSNM